MAKNSGQIFLAVPKGLMIDTINYINGSPTGAVAKGDVDRLLMMLRQCQPVQLQTSQPTPDGDGGEPAPKPETDPKLEAVAAE